MVTKPPPGVAFLDCGGTGSRIDSFVLGAAAEEDEDNAFGNLEDASVVEGKKAFVGGPDDPRGIFLLSFSLLVLPFFELRGDGVETAVAVISNFCLRSQLLGVVGAGDGVSVGVSDGVGVDVGVDADGRRKPAESSA